MAQFPHIDIEEKVQIVDKTRFDASKSYKTPNESAFSACTITPGIGASAISVFSTDQKNWFLDYEWSSFTFDVDNFADKIDFEEAGVALVATLSGGAYTSKALLIAELQAALNAAGSNTYTVSISSKDKITISADGNFKILGATGENKNNSILPHIGFLEDTDNGPEHTGVPMEYGIRKIVVTTTVGTGLSAVSESKSFYQKVYTVEGDRLPCSDSDLAEIEQDIRKWVKPGRNTHKNMIRRAQEDIFSWLDMQGYVDIYSKPFTKWDIKDSKELKEWACRLTLHKIFNDSSNAVNDKFELKSNKYLTEAKEWRNRFLRIDLDKDGEIVDDEFLKINTASVFRR